MPSTVETAKHRIFVFLDASVLADNRLVNIALSDAHSLGVLSSRIHLSCALAAGSTLEDRPVYVKTTCFARSHFPQLAKLSNKASAKMKTLASPIFHIDKRVEILFQKFDWIGS